MTRQVVIQPGKECCLVGSKRRSRPPGQEAPVAKPDLRGKTQGGEQLHRQKLKRSRDFMRRLMPMTGRRFASDDLELCRVQKGFAMLC
eukprot:s1566_g11.t1